MMKKKILFIVCLIFIIVITIFSMNSNKIITTSAQVISNKKIEWGIKRGKNHQQPDFGSENEKIINEYNGICIGSNEEPYVYLTYDCGYEAGYTDEILDILKQNNVKAAFFITGHYLNTQSELIQRMIKEGHIIGNHTVNHYCMPDISDEMIIEEIQTLHTTMYEKFNYEMKYIRPPKGEFSERTLNISNSLGYTTVMWSFAYDDWDEDKQGREEYAKEKILSNIHNGCVILLHANSKDNCNILDDIIKQIKSMGYEFKTLDEFKK